MTTDKQFQEAIATGGLAALEALADRCAADVVECGSMREKAALYRRLQSLVHEIAAARDVAKAEGDVIDQLVARRNARRAKASVKTVAKRRS